MPRRLIHTVRRPKAAAPHTSQAFEDWKAICVRRHPQAVERQLVNVRMRLEDPDLLDREDRIEQLPDPGARRCRREHPRLAVRKNRGPQAAIAQPAQHVRHLAVGIKLQVCLHQRLAHCRIDAGTGERIVERIAGHLPEIGMAAHQRPQPGVLQLLAAPQLGQSIGPLAELGTQTCDRGVHVEQRAVGIEHAGFDADHAGAHDAGPGSISGKA